MTDQQVPPALAKARVAQDQRRCPDAIAASRNLRGGGFSGAGDGLGPVSAARSGGAEDRSRGRCNGRTHLSLSPSSDLRGTREGLVLDWGGEKLPLLPGSQLPGFTTGATGMLRRDQPMSAPIDFSIALDVNGSGGIFFAPFGVQNEAELKSNWPDPGFRGAFLPAERSVRADGFDAKWKISYYGRDYPQQWTSRSGNERFNERDRLGVALWRAIALDSRRLSLCRALNQIWRALFRPRLHDVFSLRSDGATENSSIPVPDGGRSTLPLLPRD